MGGSAISQNVSALSDEFIKTNCALESTSFVPEVKLWLASEITPLWLATESILGEIPPPFWAFFWAGGQGLTRYILDNPQLVAGKRVLDFAAGSGASGIAAGMCGAARVELADIDPLARKASVLNAKANNVSVEVLHEDVVGQANRWDVIVAGDICYEKPMTAHIWPWLQQMAAQGAVVLMADPGRSYLPQASLEILVEYVVPTSREIEDCETRCVCVFRVAS